MATLPRRYALFLPWGMLFRLWLGRFAWPESKEDRFMFVRYRHLPISQQIIVAAVAFLLLVFALVTVASNRLNEQSAIAETEQELHEQARVLASILDAYFENVRVRGERQARFLRQWLGGEIRLGEGRVKTGEVELPVLRLGGDILNGQHRRLEEFRELTGDDIAFLVLDGGKVYRAATLLKDCATSFL